MDQFHPRADLYLLDFCLSTTYLKFNDSIYRQEHDCAIESPVSLIVVDLWIWNREHWTPSRDQHWATGSVCGWSWVTIKAVEVFIRRVSSVDNIIKFTRDDANDNKLPSGLFGERRKRSEPSVWPTETQTFCHQNPLHWAEHVSTKTEEMEGQQKLQACGHPDLEFVWYLLQLQTEEEG